MKGIDISMHNRAVDFNSVKNAGIDAVYIKATEGVNYIDPYYKIHLNKVKNTGLLFGMYHFMSEKTDPGEQAKDFWNAIKDSGFTLIPVLDIETNSLNRSKTEISNRCILFLTKFKALSNIDCIIYTGGYFGRDLLDNRVKKYKGWIAHYGVTRPMNTGFTVVGHQYTDSGSVLGVNGKVDMNNFTTGIILLKRNNTNTENLVNNPGGNVSISHYEKCKAYNSPNIIEIQSKLIAIGYDCGGYGVDGIYGRGTHKSIGDFQLDNGLVVDNMFGKNTREKVNSRLSSYICGINYVTPGPTAYIQRKLGIKVDGIFYTETEKAVKELQRKCGITVDGIVGPKTWKFLL